MPQVMGSKPLDSIHSLDSVESRTIAMYGYPNYQAFKSFMVDQMSTYSSGGLGG